MKRRPPKKTGEQNTSLNKTCFFVFNFQTKNAGAWRFSCCLISLIMFFCLGPESPAVHVGPRTTAEEEVGASSLHGRFALWESRGKLDHVTIGLWSTKGFYLYKI